MRSDVSKEFADRVRKYLETHEVTQSEFAEKVNVSPPTVSQWLSGARMPSVTKLAEVEKIIGSHLRTVPILGQVGAGYPMYAEENILGEEEIAPSLPGEYFALKIHGDSMSPRMQDGDVVICRKQETAEDGDIVIVIGAGEALCKRLRMYKDGIELYSINPDYRPLSFSLKEIKDKQIQIIGKAVEVRGKL